MKAAINAISKYQKYLLGLAIFLALSAVSITIGKGEVSLNLQNYPIVMLLLVAASIVLALIYVRIDKHRINELSIQIKQHSQQEEGTDFVALLSKLTDRQREVYELIVAGKTNKEIMAALFIEQSTLKSHINQVYKKLNIASRSELKEKLRS